MCTSGYCIALCCTAWHEVAYTTCTAVLCAPEIEALSKLVSDLDCTPANPALQIVGC